MRSAGGGAPGRGRGALSLLRRRYDEPVAHVPHGADQLLVLGTELGAEPPHVHVDGPGATEVVVAPDLLEQLFAAEDPAGVLREVLEELELLEGEVERPST